MHLVWTLLMVPLEFKLDLTTKKQRLVMFLVNDILELVFRSSINLFIFRLQCYYLI